VRSRSACVERAAGTGPAANKIDDESSPEVAFSEIG
jgi:hypothetical protein